MQFENNWKFKKWEKEMKNSTYHSDCSLRAYMQTEIYPEDIEVFLNVLMPKVFYIGNQVFFDIDGECEDIIRQAYNKPDTLKRTVSERQKDWNSINVNEIFLNNRDNSSDTTIMNIAHLIKRNWEIYLKEIIKDGRFMVEIYGDNFEPWVTFYQY